VSKRGSGSSARAGGFSKAQKAAISAFEERYIPSLYQSSGEKLVGDITYKKGEGDKIEISFTTQKTFRENRSGKFVDPEKYDVMERTTHRSITMYASDTGMRMHHNQSTSEEKLISRHRPPRKKRK
jgi:hypothetical protein